MPTLAKVLLYTYMTFANKFIIATDEKIIVE
jgi:hypothetical protein